MKHLRDTVVENQTLSIEGSEVWYLGPELRMRNCDISIRVSSKALVINRVVFENCNIHAAKKVSNFRWCNALIKDCKVTGSYSGCDFGHWPEFFDPDGGLVGCDLSNAKMDGCRYIDCDMSTITLPPWPYFTFYQPLLHYSTMVSMKWPGKMDLLIKSFDMYPRSTSGVTFSATEIAKRYEVEVGDLKDALNRLDWVHIF